MASFLILLIKYKIYVYPIPKIPIYDKYLHIFISSWKSKVLLEILSIVFAWISYNADALHNILNDQLQKRVREYL